MRSKWVEAKVMTGTEKTFPSERHPFRIRDFSERLASALPLKPVDLSHLVYMGILAVLFWFFRANLPGWPAFLSLHLLGIFIILALARTRRQAPGSAILSFIRTWYHLPVFLLLFEEIHWIVHLFRPDWMDGILLRFDHPGQTHILAEIGERDRCHLDIHHLDESLRLFALSRGLSLTRRTRAASP